MGMFDWVKYNGDNFQTKDLCRTLDIYMISGTELWLKEVEREWDEDEGLFGGFVELSHKWVKHPYTGALHFYDRETEYTARFVAGIMTELIQHASRMAVTKPLN